MDIISFSFEQQSLLWDTSMSDNCILIC